MVAVRDVVKVRRISPTGATRRTGRAGLPGAQQLVAVIPVRTHRAVCGGRGAVGIVTSSTSTPGFIVHADGRRARTGGPGGAVGAFRASIGVAVDAAFIVQDINPLRDREGDLRRCVDRNSVRREREIEETEKEMETKAQT